MNLIIPGLIRNPPLQAPEMGPNRLRRPARCRLGRVQVSHFLGLAICLNLA